MNEDFQCWLVHINWCNQLVVTLLLWLCIKLDTKEWDVHCWLVHITDLIKQLLLCFSGFGSKLTLRNECSMMVWPYNWCNQTVVTLLQWFCMKLDIKKWCYSMLVCCSLVLYQGEFTTVAHFWILPLEDFPGISYLLWTLGYCPGFSYLL